MKKILVTLLLTMAAVLFLEPAQTLLSKFLLLEKPVEREIREGDWLSKIAKEYYNDSSYWRELALVNRAPRGDKIFPGEKVIVPSFEAIREIRRARSLSKVNELIQQQQKLMTATALSKRADMGTAPEPDEPAAVSSPTSFFEPEQEEAAPASTLDERLAVVERPSKLNVLLLAGVLGLALVLVAAIYFYIRKRKSEEVEVYGHTSESIEDIESGRSVYRDGYDDEPRNQDRRKQHEVESV
jgi:hypothetical protein